MTRRQPTPPPAYVIHRTRLAAAADASWPSLVAELRQRAIERRARHGTEADSLPPAPPPPGELRP